MKKDSFHYKLIVILQFSFFISCGQQVVTNSHIDKADVSSSVTEESDGNNLFIGTDENEEVLGEREESITVYHNLNAGDTVFLKKESRITYYYMDNILVDSFASHKHIYIDPDRHSPYYDLICNFDINTTLPKASHSLHTTPKSIPSGLPRQWVPLHLYKEHYYLYVPCEFVFNKYAITPKYWVSWNMEGVSEDEYESIKPLSEQIYQVTFNEQYHITIYIIDPKQGIAIFEEVHRLNKSGEQYLMIRADKARQYPIIRHSCDEKEGPYEFELPDYNQIIEELSSANNIKALLSLNMILMPMNFIFGTPYIHSYEEKENELRLDVYRKKKPAGYLHFHGNKLSFYITNKGKGFTDLDTVDLTYNKGVLSLNNSIKVKCTQDIYEKIIQYLQK